MSFQINISGHSSENHNDQVKAVAEEAARKLKALPGSTVTLGGYSNDNTGRINLTTPTYLPSEP
jgi:hypothetical protein